MVGWRNDLKKCWVTLISRIGCINQKANFGLLNCLYKPEPDKARLLIMISPGSAQAPKRKKLQLG